MRSIWCDGAVDDVVVWCMVRVCCFVCVCVCVCVCLGFIVAMQKHVCVLSLRVCLQACCVCVVYMCCVVCGVVVGWGFVVVFLRW